MQRVVVLAGGSPHAHDFVRAGAAIAGLTAGAGFDVRLLDDPDAAARILGDDVDAVVVYGLWWRMLGGAFDDLRDEHGYSPSETTRAAFETFVRNGGGLLAVHTAVICFDDWPEWRTIVGGAWQWGTSSHPPYGPVRAVLVSGHPVVGGVGPVIELEDEVYSDLDVSDAVEVIASSKRHADDVDQPVMWTHRYGAGRVVFDGFGHDVDSIIHPGNARILGNALGWITEEQ